MEEKKEVRLDTITVSIAEAIRLRADLKKKIQEHINLMKGTAKVPVSIDAEEMTGGASYSDLIEEYDQLMYSLTAITTAISEANNTVMIDPYEDSSLGGDEVTLSEAIAERDAHNARAGVAQAILNSITERGYSDEEFKINASVKELKDFVSGCRSVARRYDNAIQKANWENEIEIPRSIDNEM